MNTDQLTGILRVVVPAALALCVARGWLPQSAIDALSAQVIAAIIAVITVASAIWSAVRNSSTKQIEHTASLKDVRHVMLVPHSEASESINHPKVGVGR